MIIVVIFVIISYFNNLQVYMCQPVKQRTFRKTEWKNKKTVFLI